MSDTSSTVRVFLADDSVLIRDRIAGMLGAAGMTVVGGAGTPRCCIDRIQASRPDVVVLDVQLKNGSGLDVLSHVHPLMPSVAFVVFSNSSSAAYRQRYLREGAFAFLDKNAEFESLGQAIAHAHLAQAGHLPTKEH